MTPEVSGFGCWLNMYSVRFMVHNFTCLMCHKNNSFVFMVKLVFIGYGVINVKLCHTDPFNMDVGYRELCLN